MNRLSLGRSSAVVASFGLALLAAPSVSAQEHNGYEGTLGVGDTQLTSGEYYDTYAFPIQAGETIEINLISSEVDPYIILKAPSGEQFENDDFEGSTTHSRIVEVAGESGEWQVLVTTFEPGEVGAYEVHVDIE